jgi:hypothetical protein
MERVRGNVTRMFLNSTFCVVFVCLLYMSVILSLCFMSVCSPASYLHAWPQNWSDSLLDCLPACLFVCLPASSSVCLLIYLTAFISSRMSALLSIRIPAVHN